jgi:hypothetical protein
MSGLSSTAVLESIEQFTFSIDEVADALLIQPMVIMNYHQKNGLDLCSMPPGRGSPRLFCLMDVYMLALLREIVPITGNASRGARDINRLAFSDNPLDDPPPPPSRRGGQKRLLRESVSLGHELFFHRDLVQLSSFGHHSSDWFLLSMDIEEGFRPYRHIRRGAQYRDNEFEDLLYHGAIARRSGAFINATMALTQVDAGLLRLIKKREMIDA